MVKTSAGAISLGEVTGDARLNTADGDITVERALATVVAKTAFGSIRVGDVARGRSRPRPRSARSSWVSGRALPPGWT